MRKVIEDQSFDGERALYGSRHIELRNCRIDGPADGESALKESQDVVIRDSYFALRYPFWHNTGLRIEHSELTPTCRAAFWYTEHVDVKDSKLHGVKAFRECRDVILRNCDINSPEFGWFLDGVTMDDCTMVGEYFMLRSKRLTFRNLDLIGKYSFQYVEDAVLENCVLNTKDALWHCKNVVVRDSVIKGEYLSWYSDNLVLERCKISGTQPLCYCTNLVLRDCEMTDTDLCFEKSQVDAVITTPVISIKNPASGTVLVPDVGEIILDDPMAKGIIKRCTTS